MITLRLYKDIDWQAIADAAEPFTPLKTPDEFLHISQRSIAVTGEENGKVMACGGITFINDDEGLVWVKVSRQCNKNAYTWTRTIIDTFRIMMASFGDLKISTYVVRNFCKGDKLACLIGMKNTRETIRHKGKVYYRYTTVN